jgi:hypothetical protein
MRAIAMNVNVAPPLTAGGDGHAGGKMTLAGAGFTNQQDRFGAFRDSRPRPRRGGGSGRSYAVKAPISIIRYVWSAALADTLDDPETFRRTWGSNIW